MVYSIKKTFSNWSKIKVILRINAISLSIHWIQWIFDCYSMSHLMDDSKGK